MTSVRVSFASAQVDENAHTARELLDSKGICIQLEHGIELRVARCYFERHFDLTQIIVEALVTVPVDVAATAAAAAIGGFVKRRFRGKVKPISVETDPDGKLNTEEQEQLIRLLLERLETDDRPDDTENGETKESA
ncbi:hypothetical protein [Lentzea flava]|uniref:Uncharacterized protein n=1 Tax=Lentzea flava TaxID=103732 RepID=A0ABQ2UCW6_9PSEU|nr:hypothetical protein [Lentzea flava]MCP2196829.1 hypothetical protein [Lentzea flava]GGU15214.1 hypothetical protein GCM10010178_03390 [Lentzea flava]